MCPLLCTFFDTYAGFPTVLKRKSHEKLLDMPKITPKKGLQLVREFLRVNYVGYL